MKRIAIILIVTCLASCAGQEAQVANRLDAVTGVTISYSQVPMVLYRDNSGQAAHARNLVHMGPLEVNRMGEFRYYLWLGIWNTLEGAGPGASRDGFESIVIFADGEPLPLDITGWTAASIGASESVYLRPVSSSADAYFEVTVDHLRLIAAASDIRIQISGNNSHTYELWNDQTSAKLSMQAFLRNSVY